MPLFLLDTGKQALFTALCLPWQGQSFHLNRIICWQCSKQLFQSRKEKRERKGYGGGEIIVLIFYKL